MVMSCLFYLGLHVTLACLAYKWLREGRDAAAGWDMLVGMVLCDTVVSCGTDEEHWYYSGQYLLSLPRSSLALYT